MGVQYKVVLRGLSAFERSALGSYFRVAIDRSPSYEQVHGIDEADFAVADADQPSIVDELSRRGRLPTSVFVGSQAPPGAVAWTMRPIDPVHVMRELDAIAALHQRPPMRSPAWPPSRPRVADGPLRRSSDSQFGPFDEWPASVPPEPPAAPPAPHPGRPDVLLVDDGDAAADALGQRLRAFGLEPVRCRPGQPALERVARDGVAVVFIDVDAADRIGVDGFTLCREVKRRHGANGNGHSPAVVLLSTQAAPVDRVRATLAGADALVTTPPADGVDGELRRLLERHGAL
jgi:CheY-like chemotaxis protein